MLCQFLILFCILPLQICFQDFWIYLAKAELILFNRYVGRFIPRKERVIQMGDKHRKYNNVYIKNFGEELDDEKLREMFTPYGNIISAKVIIL